MPAADRIERRENAPRPSRRPVPLGENHKRGLTTALVRLDEMLCDIEEWARGRERRSVLYKERNDLPPAERRALLREVDRIRRDIADARDRLRLEAPEQSAADEVWARCAAVRENLMELESRQLRRYGAVHRELARCADALSARLLEGVDRLLDAVSGRHTRPPAD